MTVAARTPTNPLMGVAMPRMAPPLPAKSKVDEFVETAVGARINLLEWQQHAGKYLTATGPDGWLYREVAIVVARQNGKTELLVPRILMDLRAGKRILHTAHRMRLARKVFLRVARLVGKEAESIRWAQGQEEIFFPNGGSYVTIAAQRGARGESADTLIIDEVREFEDHDVIDAASPTLSASPDPQTIYLSNAGSYRSVVLNDLKRRGEDQTDPELAYLEWSADRRRDVDDREGWMEANPALGHFLKWSTMENAFRGRPTNSFKTEHLCQWVESEDPHLVSLPAWMQCNMRVESTPVRPAIGFNMDPNGTRASVVMAWLMTNGRVALVELAEARGENPGDPIDLPAFVKEVKELVATYGVKHIAYAPWTDQDFAQHFARAEPMDGKLFAQACEKFVRYVMSGLVAWDGATHVTEDLAWTARKSHESGGFHAVAATPDKPVTAVLAAIRAVWQAAAPRTVPRIG